MAAPMTAAAMRAAQSGTPFLAGRGSAGPFGYAWGGGGFFGERETAVGVDHGLIGDLGVALGALDQRHTSTLGTPRRDLPPHCRRIPLCAVCNIPGSGLNRLRS
jgi:hypothetical protein